MKNIRRYWQESSKKLRILLNLLLIAILIFALYTFISAPSFTREIQFRRTEKANLVGPSTILGDMEGTFSEYDLLTLADDRTGVIIYAQDSRGRQETQLIWRKKTGPVTVLAAPDPTPYDGTVQEKMLTVLAFDSYPQAVRAEMELTLNASYYGTYSEKTYYLSSQREIPGVFRFDLHIHNSKGIGAEGYALHILMMISGSSGQNFIDSCFPVTVRFYDASDSLIGEETTFIMSVAAQAKAEHP